MNKKRNWLLVISAKLLYLVPSFVVAATLPSSIEGQELPSLANVVETVEHGIVNISTRGTQSYQADAWGGPIDNLFEGDNFFRKYFRFDNRRQVQSVTNLGSGVVYDAEMGYIITNQHVLENAAQITVTLSDGREALAEVVGTDPEMDLALLNVDLTNLSEVKIGDSDQLRVGDFVLAIGNNYGLSATVTSGIVSALGRSGLRLPRLAYQDFIQTDAAINPGSSGGALVNLRGEVIGINTAIFAPTGGNVGIGFAIPMNTAASVAQQIADHGRVKRGILGIRFQEISRELADAYELIQTTGVLVSDVEPSSAADQAGLQEGDILTHIDGVEINDGSQLRSLIALIRVGEKVDVRYSRDGMTFEHSGTIGDRGGPLVSGSELSNLLAGVKLQNVEVYGTKIYPGVQISVVDKESSAWQLGVREGDFISEVNHVRVHNVDALKQVMNNDDGRLILKIHRDGKSRYLVIG